MIRGPIVVGYDGSDAARRAVARAGEVAGSEGEVVVVSVARDPLPNSLHEPTGESPSPEETETLLEEAAGLLRRDGAGPAVATRSEKGDAAEALIDAAREAGASLIVVGARGRSFVDRTLLGSVAEMLVKRAPCDVLVTR